MLFEGYICLYVQFTCLFHLLLLLLFFLCFFAAKFRCLLLLVFCLLGLLFFWREERGGKGSFCSADRSKFCILIMTLGKLSVERFVFMFKIMLTV